jgi:hypothetical protein
VPAETVLRHHDSIETPVAGRDVCVTFSWSGDAHGQNAALSSAAALTKVIDGICYDPDMDMIYLAADVVEDFRKMMECCSFNQNAFPVVFYCDMFAFRKLTRMKIQILSMFASVASVGYTRQGLNLSVIWLRENMNQIGGIVVDRPAIRPILATCV